MSLHTGIQWCDSSANPAMGCDACELWPAAAELGGAPVDRGQPLRQEWRADLRLRVFPRALRRRQPDRGGEATPLKRRRD